MVQKKEYESIACGGFSGGCDMLLRAIAFTSVCCDLIILQGTVDPGSGGACGNCGFCNQGKEYCASDFLRFGG